jgi:ribose 5-phosphate isomerase A
MINNSILDKIDIIHRLGGNSENTQNLLKMLLGWEIADRVKNNQMIGLGSGSTAEMAILAIGKRIEKDGIKIKGVASSVRVSNLAKEVKIEVVEIDLKKETPKDVYSQIPQLDWGFDGADEIEENTLNMIKGGGDKSTIERLVARKCKKWIIIIDESKIVTSLGAFPIPVEIKPDYVGSATENINTRFKPQTLTLRTVDGTPLITDLGNRIVRTQMRPGEIDRNLETVLLEIPGVVDTGLFLGGWPDEVLIASKEGSIKSIQGKGLRK